MLMIQLIVATFLRFQRPISSKATRRRTTETCNEIRIYERGYRIHQPFKPPLSVICCQQHNDRWKQLIEQEPKSHLDEGLLDHILPPEKEVCESDGLLWRMAPHPEEAIPGNIIHRRFEKSKKSLPSTRQSKAVQVHEGIIATV
jgi:hypothetical protein